MQNRKNLIIDGHGRELSGQSFNFKRSKGNECTLYCYVNQGISIGIQQSNGIIRDVVRKGNPSKEIAVTQLASRIGGQEVTDKELSAIQHDKDGNPQWSNDDLFTVGPTRIQINGIDVDEFSEGNNTYIRLPIASHKTLKLSQIIQYYNVGQYDIFWCVCRAE